MPFNDFMSKVRYWDNRTAKWMIRHFYLLFFEVFLVFIFVGLFVITLRIIDASTWVSKNVVERLLLLQSIISVIITLLLLLNSFWMLYIFNEIIRTRSTLKEINFNLTKRKTDH